MWAIPRSSSLMAMNSSQLGKRRWRVMGDPEDGWWVEVDSDGSELPGDWEYDRKGGYVYCSFS